MSHLDQYSPRERREIVYIALQHYRWLKFSEKKHLLRNFNMVVRRFAELQGTLRFIDFAQECFPEQTAQPTDRLRQDAAVELLAEMIIHAEALVVTRVTNYKLLVMTDYGRRRTRIHVLLSRFRLAVKDSLKVKRARDKRTADIRAYRELRALQRQMHFLSFRAA